MKKQIIIVTLTILIFSLISVNAIGQQMLKIHEIEPTAGQYTLSNQEIDGLLLMREEEKLARDVYLELYDKWELNIFQNIAKSEQTHTDAVKTLLNAYEITDPVKDDQRGIFENEELKSLYDSLTEQGKESLSQAIIVGLTVEDLDIKDLEKLLEQTKNPDIILVYNNLLKGSQNHLRAFNKQAQKNSVEYTAQFISQEEFSSIISGENQRGSIMINENSEIKQNFQNQLKINQNRQFRLSNGKNAQIKIMPETASKKAIEQLKLNNCEEECTIDLKEVRYKNSIRAAYEIKTKKNSKLFGIFNKEMELETQIDAETGEILNTKKPWWSFLTFG